MNLLTYNLGGHVLNGLDVSIPQKNYMMKYGSKGLLNQKQLFSTLGIQKNFKNRVVVANNFSGNILEIKDNSYSGYYKYKSKCNNYDAIITQKKQLPLFTVFGDCPQIMVAGKNTIGLIHCARDLLDRNIISHFFSHYVKLEDVTDTVIGISPYIFEENFTHEYLKVRQIDKWLKHSTFNKNIYKLNLFSFILEELIDVGIKNQNIFNMNIDTWLLSEKSLLKGGEFVISHRYAKKHGLREGRGGMVIMLK